MINFIFEGVDGLVKKLNTRVGLDDGIVHRSQAVYEIISGSIDPIVRDNEYTWITVNLELTPLKRKVRSTPQLSNRCHPTKHW